MNEGSREISVINIENVSLGGHYLLPWMSTLIEIYIHIYYIEVERFLLLGIS